MPAANALHAIEVAATFNVIILVRPTNPQAPVLLERGLLPKPEAIKAKSIKSKDVVLRAHAGITSKDLGKVGWFEPQFPTEMNKRVLKAGDLLPRYSQRLKEQADEKQKIAKLVIDKRIEIVRGKIVDRRTHADDRGPRPLCHSRHPGQAARDRPGKRKMLEKKEDVVAALRSGSFKARHGVHLDWKPKSPSDQSIFDVIVKAHQNGEPLLKITPAAAWWRATSPRTWHRRNDP